MRTRFYLLSILLLLVVALCAWSVYSTIEDPETLTEATDAAPTTPRSSRFVATAWPSRGPSPRP